MIYSDPLEDHKYFRPEMVGKIVRVTINEECVTVHTGVLKRITTPYVALGEIVQEAQIGNMTLEFIRGGTHYVEVVS